MSFFMDWIGLDGYTYIRIQTCFTTKRKLLKMLSSFNVFRWIETFSSARQSNDSGHWVGAQIAAVACPLTDCIGPYALYLWVSMFSALLLVHFLAKWNGTLTEMRCLRYIKRNGNEYRVGRNRCHHFLSTVSRITRSNAPMHWRIWVNDLWSFVPCAIHSSHVSRHRS